MRELCRVFANEWMKLMYRRRLWITILLGALVVCGLTFISYMGHQNTLEYHSLENREQRLHDLQQRLQEVKEQSPNETQPEDRPQQEIRILQEQIANLKQQIERSKKINSEDWKSVVKQKRTETKEQIEQLSAQGDAGSAAYLKGELMEIDYRLSHDVRPHAIWERSGHDQMSGMMEFTSIIFLPMLVVILVADMVSGETTTGTIKLLLVRPVSRGKILFGKWMVSITAAGILTIVFCFVIWGANIALYGTEGANQPVMTGVDYTFEMEESTQPGIPAHRESIPHYEDASIVPQWQYILTGVFLLAFSMAVVATITLLCSTLFKSAMVSTGVAFGFIIIAQILVEMVNSGKWLFWLFAVHLNLQNHWTGDLSANLGMNLPLWLGALILIAWAAVSLTVGLVYFKRRDVLNA